MMPIIIALCVVGTIFSAFMIFRPWRKKSNMNTFMQQSLEELAMEEINFKREQNIGKKSWLDKKKEELNEADINIDIAKYMAIAVVACVGIFLYMQYLFGIPMISVCVAAVGLYLPTVIVEIAKEKKNAEFDANLAVALKTIASSMRAGASLVSAVESVVSSKTMAISIKKEFKKVAEEAKSNRYPIDVAFKRMAERTKSKNANYVAIVVKVNYQTGGQMAAVFENAATTITQTALTKRSVKATLSESKSNSVILTCIPFAIVTMLKLTSPEYFAPMVSSPVGQIVIIVSLCAVFAGYVVVSKMSNIKY